MFSWRLFLLATLAIGADQATKFWAVASLGGPMGEVTYESVPVLGDWFRFTLAYNEGAAFSIKPQAIAPFMSPTLFFTLITLLAGTGLFYFLMRGLPKYDWVSRAGVYFILAGALGNLIDRIRIGKVVDFLDCEFIDIGSMQRWPIFNLADSWVSIGIVAVLLAPWIWKKMGKNYEADRVLASAPQDKAA
jgi:signal peptidase II